MVGRERFGPPTGERVVVEVGEGHAVLDAAVLLGRADGCEKRMSFGEGRPEGRRGLALLFHEDEQCPHQFAGEALAPVGLPHAAPDIDEGRIGFVVGRAFAANAHVEAAGDVAAAVQRQNAMDGVKGRVLAHVLLGVGIARQGLVRKVFLVAKTPVGKGLRPLLSGRPLGIENESREMPRIGGTGFKHGGP